MTFVGGETETVLTIRKRSQLLLRHECSSDCTEQNPENLTADSAEIFQLVRGCQQIPLQGNLECGFPVWKLDGDVFYFLQERFTCMFFSKLGRADLCLEHSWNDASPSAWGTYSELLYS